MACGWRSNCIRVSSPTIRNRFGACGRSAETIGVNFDPSHLFWQNIRVNGVLDTKPYSDEKGRSWIFRTVGYGHGQEFWRSLISELRMAGYDGVISIEHEDSLMSINEGFTSAVEFLKDVVITESPAQAWWV